MGINAAEFNYENISGVTLVYDVINKTLYYQR